MNKYCVFSRLFSLLLLIYMSNLYRCEVTKCCSENYILRIANGYFCELSIDETFTSNLQISLPSNCSGFRNVFEGHDSYIELNGCIDKDKNDKYIAITCSKNSTTGVHLINKCCPIGESYDNNERFCVPNFEVHNHFKKLFKNISVVFKNHVPNCSTDEVYVEYLSTVHNIHFNSQKLNVNGDTLESSRFCIEDLVNIDSIENEERHVIVRSCRSRSICENIPCIRRCCKADQVMEPRDNGHKTCRNHPKNLQPTFYNVTQPLDESQKPTIVKGERHICVIDG